MSRTNAPTKPASDESAYEAWRRDLDAICRKRLSLGVGDLPSLPVRDGFDAGKSPKEFFDDSVIPHVREEHGTFVDELLAAVPDHEDLMGDAPPMEP